MVHRGTLVPGSVWCRYGMVREGSGDEAEILREEELWKDSPWPPRNAPAFDLLNAFMER